MRIIRLQAEGFKRLVAVDISPEGDLVELRGDNGNGKSSVLDAIYAALAGAGAAPEKPVRDGEEMAIIRLDLGDMIVTRYFTAEGTTKLKVTNREGFSADNGQTMLNKLLGHISFDPLEFIDLKPEEQAEELRKLITIADPETGEVLDLAAIETANKADYAKRRDVNRDAIALKARVEARGVAFVPDVVPDRDALLSEMASAAETNSALERSRQERIIVRGRRDEMATALAEAEQRVTDLRESLAKADSTIALYDAEPLGEPVNVEALRAKIEEADRIAQNVAANAERDRMKSEFDALKVQSETLTKAMADRDEKRAKAIAGAEMPVKGLELHVGDDGKLGVTFNSIPFSQASDAEQLRVSVAVAMAANPELRVIRLKNASLLDKKAVEALRELATSNDFQIWAEFVGDEGPGIIMEAGAVRGADAPEPLDRPKTRKKAVEEVREGESATATDGPAATETEKSAVSSTAGDVSRGTAGELLESGDALVRGADDNLYKVSPSSTLFERLAVAAEEAPRRPRAMTEFVSKPQGEN